MSNAPYSGGFGYKGSLHTVDGNFTVASLVGNPQLSYPFKGDSIVAARGIAVPVTDATVVGFKYEVIPVGTFPNLQPFNITQSAAIIEMKMVVAMMFYNPLLLNTRLDPALFTQNDFVTNYNANNVVALNNFYLVSEDQFEEISAGIFTFRRVYASIPPTRNIPSQIGYKFPGFGDDPVRLAYTQPVNCRIQHDYYIYDPSNITGLAPYSAGGLRLETLDLGSYFNTDGNPYLNLREQLYRVGSPYTETNSLSDEAGDETITVPTLSQYIAWYGNVEIVAEGSVLNPYMGNIYERITKFILAQ